MDGGSTTNHTLTKLEESTLYTITLKATTSDNRTSSNSNKVSVKTYTDGKCCIIHVRECHVITPQFLTHHHEMS